MDVYLLPGNHDPLDAASVYTSELFLAEKPANVHVLDTAGRHRVAPGVELVAVPWRSKAPTHDLVAEQLAGLPADGTRRIVVAHGGVDMLDPDPTKPALIALEAVEDAIDRGAIHYVALGDKHSRTQVGSSGRVWYSGAPRSPTTTMWNPTRGMRSWWIWTNRERFRLMPMTWVDGGS